ncbi:hypothetical protein NL676_029370 [Syzygium grande]|nr:hypothetical protein NL676_029370 [Syzygium grande]
MNTTRPSVLGLQLKLQPSPPTNSAVRSAKPRKQQEPKLDGDLLPPVLSVIVRNVPSSEIARGCSRFDSKSDTGEFAPLPSNFLWFSDWFSAGRRRRLKE